MKTVEADIKTALDKIALKDPDFKYELQGVPSPLGNRAVNRNPKDVPLDSPIIRIVHENHKYVTGESAIFTEAKDVLHNDDGGHMNESGIQTISYGPGGDLEDENYSNSAFQVRYIDIVTMHINGKVMSLSSYDVCSLIK